MSLLPPPTSGPLPAIALVILACFAPLLPAAPVINEIHYNNDVNYVPNEFIEIYNPDGSSVDLSGWIITGGVEFTFPTPTVLEADGYLVVAEDPATTSSIFGIEALGPFSGGLSGEGEEIELRDASGNEVDRVDYDVDFPWPIRADGGGSSMELIHHSLDNDLGSSWRSSTDPRGDVAPPSPGAVNSVASETAPPNIRQVTHVPKQPTDAQTTVVTAKVTDPDGVASVLLEYVAIEPGAYVPAYIAKTTSNLLSNPTAPRDPNPRYEAGWESIPMVDNGVGDDTLAGDDIFTATVPTQGHRTLVRYRIRVADSRGAAVTAPFADDESLNFAYFVYNGIPDYETGDTVHPAEKLETLPAYHLLTTKEDFDQAVAYNGGDQIPRDNLDARSEFNWSGTFVYDGKVYDNIKYRLRQRNARYSGAGKRSFRFRFNRGNYVQFHDHWGNPYPTKWRTLNSHKMEARGGINFGLYEAANSMLWNTTGTPAPFTHWFHFRVITQEPEQRNETVGDFHGFLLGMEDYDRRFLTAHDLPDGNLYKLKSGVTEGTEVQRYQSPWGPTDGSDYENIIFNVRSMSEGVLDRTISWEDYYRYHAIVDAVRHYDVQPNTGEHLKNRAFYFEPSERNRRFGLLNTLPWDSDTSWGPNWNGGVDFVMQALRRSPRYVKEYKNVVREIRDLVWQRPQLFGLIDMLEAQIRDFQPADRERWNYNGDPRTRAGDMKRFAFIGGSWTGGTGGGMEAISMDTGVSGQEGRDAYLDALAEDPEIPETPTLTDLSPPDHPSNGLRFQSSDFSDNRGDFKAMEYRIAEFGLYQNDGQPFPLEWVASWESGELTTFTPEISPPASAVRAGKTYRARVRHMDDTDRWSHWSEPVEFTVTAPDVVAYQQNLIISEINYNPDGSDDTEFIELKNIGESTLSLADIRFTKGIDFDFAADATIAPGAFLLVVKNQAAFEAFYGTGLPVAGEYQFAEADSLDNAGERIKLALGALAIHDFEYDDDLPWPEAADAGGFTLVLANTVDNSSSNPLDPLGHGLFSNWRASTVAGGTPGTEENSDPVFTGDPDADEDRDHLSALLEHALGTDDSDPTSGPNLIATAFEDGDLILTYQRNLLATDVVFRPEFSLDLITWFQDDGTFEEVPNGDGTSAVTYRLAQAALEHDTLFIRLRVELTTGP